MSILVDRRRALGARGESFAESLLAARGATIIARNVRTRWGEIDLICRDGSGLLFVEVKTRRTSSFVAAAESVTARKRNRLVRLALAWLDAHHERGVRWRLQLCAVTVDGARARADFLDLL